MVDVSSTDGNNTSHSHALAEPCSFSHKEAESLFSSLELGQGLQQLPQIEHCRMLCDFQG